MELPPVTLGDKVVDKLAKLGKRGLRVGHGRAL
jgi:hypothetical protein